MNAPSKSVVLMASDLMLSSTVSGYAATAGVKFQSVGDVGGAEESLAAAGSVLLLIDIGLPGLDVDELAKSVSADVLESAIAYGPHVHTEKLNAAENAGIGTVISRGQFSAQIGQLIAAFAAQ